MTWHIPTAAYSAAIPMPTDYDFDGRLAELALKDTIKEVLGEDPGIEVTAAVVEGHPATRLIEAAVGRRACWWSAAGATGPSPACSSAR